MKKMYLAPDLEILILEMADVITASGPTSGTPGTGGGGNAGAMDKWE